MSATVGIGVSTTETPRRSTSPDRWFFSGFAIAAAVAIFWGFSPSYFLRPIYGPPPGASPLSPLIHVHGLLFTSWIVLLAAQTTLIASSRTHIHRRLGVIGGVLAVAMVIVGYMAGIDAARRGSAIPGMTPLGFLIIPIAGIVVFAVLIACAFALRRRPDYHKRLVVLATTDLLTAGVARIPAIGARGAGTFFAATDIFVLALVVYDLVTRRRIHPATLWGGAFLVASQPLQLWLANTGAWTTVAGWLTR